MARRVAGTVHAWPAPRSGRSRHRATVRAAPRVGSAWLVLGPPSEVKSGEGRGGYAPDLLAYWHHPGIVYSVRALIPAGCKLDPRSPEPISWAEHEERAPKLHPECKAVLAELEDL